jgi:hypothetical protein
MLKKGEPYKDQTVDYEAKMVKKNAPRWIKALQKFRMISASVSDAAAKGLNGAESVQV